MPNPKSPAKANPPQAIRTALSQLDPDLDLAFKEVGAKDVKEFLPKSGNFAGNCPPRVRKCKA